jgi:hypothetical protein
MDATIVRWNNKQGKDFQPKTNATKQMTEWNLWRRLQ